MREPIINIEKFNQKNRNFVFKDGKKQILLIGVEEKIFAIDNRCPHEGYPLSEGTTTKNCVLTCNWHNWKFDLKTGLCILGGDHVRTYPVEIKNGDIYVDTKGPSKEETKKFILDGLKIAFSKRQYGRLAREITRLEFNDIDPLEAVKQSILWSFDKFEYGMTHAYAACSDWISLYKTLEPSRKEEKIVCLTETIDHIAYDSLRHPEYPFTEEVLPFNEGQYLNAIEKEDENTAIALINGPGITFKQLEKTLAEAALAHYNDFGHSLIYVYKAKTLSDHFQDPQVDACLLKALTRSLVNTTREDLIPEFKDYQDSLSQLKKFGDKKESPSFEELTNKRVKASLDWVNQKAQDHNPESLYKSLLLANADNMTHYNLDFQEAFNNPVTQNVGWLDFTHALTFSNAVRAFCSKYPDLWPKGLLQMACFYGRNSFFTDRTLNVDTFKIKNTQDFENQVIEKILDHGMPLPIYSAHVLKTAFALFEEGKGLNTLEKEIIYRPLNRFLNSPLKAKHIRRLVKQAFNLVSKDF